MRRRSPVVFASWKDGVFSMLLILVSMSRCSRSPRRVSLSNTNAAPQQECFRASRLGLGSPECGRTFATRFSQTSGHYDG
jgi:hypothetical protein